MKVRQLRIRASYPNYYMVNVYAREGHEIFDHDSEDPANQLEGNKPGTVRYQLEGDPDGFYREFPPRWYDMNRLLRLRDDKQIHFLELLLGEREGSLTDEEQRKLDSIRKQFRNDCIQYVKDNPLTSNEYLITTLTPGDFTDEEISYKGRMLLDLTRNSYPVPDFCILTSKSIQNPSLLSEHLKAAIRNLEIMTRCRLGDSRNPLVFAIRCAMPQYIPGLMPTLLNIGVTRTAYEALTSKFELPMANRVYLSTLHTICEMMGIEHRYQNSDILLSTDDQRQLIRTLEERISSTPDGDRIINDAEFQVL